MKKKPTLLLLFPLILSGCSLINYHSDSEESKEEHSSSQTEIESSEESITEESNVEEQTSDDRPLDEFPLLEDGKLLLNPYGDYVTYTDGRDASTLLETFTDLTKVVTSEKNGIYQTSYQRGLLEFFNFENKVEICIDISKAELNKLNHDYAVNNRESYRECKIDIKYLGLDFHYEGVGIRQKGNTSRGEILDGDNLNLRHYKISFEETFDDEYTSNPKTWVDDTAKEYRGDREFFGISKIDLRWNRNKDTTYTREYYAYEMYRANGGLSARSNPVAVSIKSGSNTYSCGVYLAVETFTKSFIKRNFVKAARGGNLYKLSWGSGQGAKFNPVGDNFFGVETLVSHGETFEQTSYTYELKTNKEDTEHAAIKNFISVLNDQHGNTAYEFANQYMDYQEFLTYAAVSYLLGDPDDLRGNYNNTYVYFTGDTNQMIIMPTDHDRALGSTGYGGNPTGHHGAQSAPFDKNTGYAGGNDSNLWNKLIFSTNSTTIRPEYISRIQEVIDNNWMSSENFESYYNVFLSNYGSLTNTSNNTTETMPSFGLNEESNLGSDGNLTVSIYLSTKVSTYNSSK